MPLDTIDLGEEYRVETQAMKETLDDQNPSRKTLQFEFIHKQDYNHSQTLEKEAQQKVNYPLGPKFHDDTPMFNPPEQYVNTPSPKDQRNPQIFKVGGL